MTMVSIGRHTHAIVTGGAGFIGTHLTRRLLAEGIRVTVLTRHIRSPRARALASLGATLVCGDLATAAGVPDERSLPPEALFLHLAADTSVEGPGVWSTNVDGTGRALDLATRLRAPYFLLASSIEAQGLVTESEGFLDESAECHPVSEYGRSKLRAESLVTTWGSEPNRRASVLRIGNTYGPGSPWLLQSALLLCLGARSLHSVWEALRHRRFQPLYVDDLVEALIRTTAARAAGVYHATGEAPVSLEDYLFELAGLLGIRHELQSRLQSPGSAPSCSIAPDFAYFLMGDRARCHRTYRNRKLRDEVGDYARWSLPRGLAATLSWYRESGAWQALLNTIRPEGRHACTSR